MGDIDVVVRFLFFLNNVELLNWKYDLNGRFVLFKEVRIGGFVLLVKVIKV